MEYGMQSKNSKCTPKSIMQAPFTSTTEKEEVTPHYDNVDNDVEYDVTELIWIWEIHIKTEINGVVDGNLTPTHNKQTPQSVLTL